jgi:hypothetical protein
MSYHLRRLRLHGKIQRIPKTHRYRLTDFGMRTAIFATRAWARIFRRGIGMILSAASPVPNPILRTFNQLTAQIHSWVDGAKLAALENLTHLQQVFWLKDSSVTFVPLPRKDKGYSDGSSIMAVS